jgi:preprotein translocase subunit SecD
MRTMIRPAVLVLLLSCPAVVSPTRAAAADAPRDAKPRLRFALVASADEKADVIEVDDPAAPGGKLRVLKDAFLDETGIATAEVTTVDGKNAVSLKMTKEGADRLGRATAANVNRRVAVLFDGRVIFAPVIRSRISDAAMITGGGQGFSDKEAKAIVDAIRTAGETERKQTQPASPGQ